MLVDIFFENATKTMVWRWRWRWCAVAFVLSWEQPILNILLKCRQFYWPNHVRWRIFFFVCAQRYSDMGSNITAINNLRSTNRYCASEQHRIKSILPWHRMQCKIAQKYDKTENSSRKIKRKPVPYEKNRSYLAWPLAKYKYKHASYAICPEQTQIQVNVDL